MDDTLGKVALFSPVVIGPLRLRNRFIRAAAFEGMGSEHSVTDKLIDYHRSVAAGDVAMTTLAYVAVARNGLSFPHQLWMRKEIVPGLRQLTDAVHREGAAVAIQLGHAGNMARYEVSQSVPLAPSSGFNWYVPTWHRAMNRHEISETVKAFGQATSLAREAGFDAVEVHAGHGYLISQFLSPWTNKRRDEFGGNLTQRMHFLRLVIEEVMKAAGPKMAVLVKINMRDGFAGGLELEESLEVAQYLQRVGVHALVLSGGFVSRAPMYILRGAMPWHTLVAGMNSWPLRVFVRMFGRWLIREVPFRENYFLEDARKFRRALSMPLVYVGGVLSDNSAGQIIDEGFDAVALARALIKDPDFVTKLRNQHPIRSTCDSCNFCVAVIYHSSCTCIQNH